MNTYRYVFAAKCPSDDETIIYGLEIRSREKIMVERIKEVCAEWPSGFQEEIAADLHALLGGSLTLRAQHQGVEIVTELESSVTLAQDEADFRTLRLVLSKVEAWPDVGRLPAADIERLREMRDRFDAKATGAA